MASASPRVRLSSYCTFAYRTVAQRRLYDVLKFRRHGSIEQKNGLRGTQRSRLGDTHGFVQAGEVACELLFQFCIRGNYFLTD